ncbi:MFS transporter [Rheinheimera texasensis]|uniref:MFS transporter n=1 Tax=Rheinheimera texasensis TaxID=306205 RepID=UPI0032B2922F
MSSQSSGLQFYHPLAFWLGCLAITAGVLAHVPMFIHASYMDYQMVGMPMDNMMLGGMALIPLGLLLAMYGLMPRLDALRGQQSPLYFHIADQIPLNRQHWTLVWVLLAAVIVDVMKPATLGFVMPGIKKEYEINSQTAGTLALVALTGTTIGSVIWGIVADKFGRRAAILLSALMFIGTAICGAMPTFEWNLIMCFLMGMSAGGLLPITFTLMAETIPAAHRGWLLVALGGIGTAGGYLVAAGSAAVLEPMFSWRVLWLLGLPTGLLLIVLNRYMPESPRFLASQGLSGQARAVLARFGSAGHGEQDVVIEQQPQARGGISQLFHAPYAGLSIGLLLAGVAWGLVNFGFLLWLPVNLGELGFAAEASAIIAKSALMAIPAVLLVIWLYHSWSSIKTLWLFLLLTALSLGSFVLFDFLQFYQPFWLSLAIALLLVSASGVIAMLIPYAAEIYPVHLRASGSGLVAASSKFGGILGAGFGVLGWFSHIGGSALAIGLALLVAALVLQRKGIETRGKALEDMHQALLEKTR